MQNRNSFREDFKSAVFRYAIWLAVLGLALIVGVAALSTTLS